MSESLATSFLMIVCRASSKVGVPWDLSLMEMKFHKVRLIMCAVGSRVSVRLAGGSGVARPISGIQLADYIANASSTRASNLRSSRQLSLYASLSLSSSSHFIDIFRNPPTAGDVVVRSQKLVLLRLG